MARITLLIVEDHQIVSKGMEMILANDPELDVLGSVSDIDDAFEKTKTHKPDVILLDLDLGRTSGLDHITTLKQMGAKHVLVVTGSSELESHRKSLENGASGTVLKQEAGTTLIEAIKGVNEGMVWVEKTMAERLLRDKLKLKNETLEERMNRERIESLTLRERAIVTLLANGHTNKEIADKLEVQEKTVRNSLTAIYSKLGVTRRLELAILAPKIGLTEG
jgi:DNA-binding NarL/FixJ family response regulator